VLERGGQSFERWRDALLALAADVRGYRAPFRVEELAEVVEAPRGSVEHRVAAALVLSTLPKEAPERLRVARALEETADPVMRSALEEALEGRLGRKARSAVR
jgi:hypothetical protein